MGGLLELGMPPPRVLSFPAQGPVTQTFNGLLSIIGN